MIDENEVVVGAGFADVWAAAAAAAVRDDAGATERDFRITVVSPGDDLVIRPGLYQSEPHRMRTALDGILGPLGVRRVAATVTGIDPGARQIPFTTAGGKPGIAGL